MDRSTCHHLAPQSEMAFLLSAFQQSVSVTKDCWESEHPISAHTHTHIHSRKYSAHMGTHAHKPNQTSCRRGPLALTFAQIRCHSKFVQGEKIHFICIYVFLMLDICVCTFVCVFVSTVALDTAVSSTLLRAAEIFFFYHLWYGQQRPAYTHNAPSQPRMHFTL